MFIDRRLGRVGGVRPDGLPRMASFLRTVPLPQLPQTQNWYSSVAAWGMLLNDKTSDCTIATVGHMAQQERIYAGITAAFMSDDEALAQYSELSGYEPGRPETDTGLYEGAVCQHWLAKGFTIGGVHDQIVGLADIDVRDIEQLKYSILLTGNIFLGFSLPNCADTTEVWDLPTTWEGAQLAGGHAVPAVGWDREYLYAVSWAKLVPITWPFVRKYLLEGHVTLSRTWLNAKGTTPAGVSWDNLVAMTEAFAGQ